jgi:ribosomal protein L11 methyltransferase
MHLIGFVENERLMKASTKPCLSVIVEADNADETSWDLLDFGAQAVEQRDETTMIDASAGQVELIAGFESLEQRDRVAKQLDELSGGRCEISKIAIGDDGWSKRWREFFKPVVLEFLQVIAPWMKPPREDRISIVIDPGQAFGTGGHATTRLILRMLEKRAASGMMSSEVLDIGCGSGVLAIAAVKLGSRSVVAIDIEEEAMLATRENAEVNNAGRQIDARMCTAADLDLDWKLVLANIQLAVFQNIAGDVAARVAHRGEALLSGLLAQQVDECMALFPGFEVTEKIEEDGWGAVAIRRIRKTQ